jgi:cytoskeletal protein CcmA (bactofilin family)
VYLLKDRCRGRASDSRGTVGRQKHISQYLKGNTQAMWKPNQPGSTPQSPNNEPNRPATPASGGFEPAGSRPAAPQAQSAAADQATIGKSLVVKGEVTGSESLYIDGKVEGAINLPGNRVTVGRNGQVAANISAREVVVLGKVRGNINASDRVDIRSEGSLTGDVIAQRISIEDGAFFKGGIDIRKPGSPDNKPSEAAKPVSV